MTWQSREKYTTISKWTHSQDAVYWIHLAKAQEKGRTLWQTRSHAIIVHDSVPPDCIEKVISEKGERTLYQRLAAPRPAPRTILKNTCNQQQQHQQQQQGTFGSSWKLQRERHEGDDNRVKEVAGNCNDHSVVREKIRFKSISEFMEYHQTSSTRTRSG